MPSSDGAMPLAETSLQHEPWAREMGIEYLDVRPGYCRLALQLQPHMMNAAGVPHGGVIFSLADTAFGTACNSYGARDAVGLSVTINYLTAAAPDARLIAEACERKRGRRAGFYDVTVTTADGTLIASAHCIAHRLSSNTPREASPGC